MHYRPASNAGLSLDYLCGGNTVSILNFVGKIFVVCQVASILNFVGIIFVV